MTSTTDFGLTRDGVVQLRRRWKAQSPWAAMLLLHGIAEHFGAHLGAVLLGHDLQWHFTGTKTRHAHCAGKLFQPLLDFAVDIGHRNGHIKAPLKLPQCFNVCLLH